jgi:hypothetical protein
VLLACEAAHRAILEQGTDVWNVGKTTILGGVVIPVQQGEKLATEEAYFVDPVDDTREVGWVHRLFSSLPSCLFSACCGLYLGVLTSLLLFLPSFDSFL